MVGCDAIPVFERSTEYARNDGCVEMATGGSWPDVLSRVRTALLPLGILSFSERPLADAEAYSHNRP